MLMEYYIGSDSFSRGRTVFFSSLVYNPKTALFTNPRQLAEFKNDPVCRNIKITQGIPASIDSLTQVTHMWYHHRCESRAGSLWLFESRVRHGGETDLRRVFEFETSYLLMRLGKTAPPVRLRYTLPEQEGANVSELEFSMNARHITSHKELTPDERGAFKRIVGETRDLVIDVTQTAEELKGWTIEQLEPDGTKKAKVITNKDRPVAIQRIRRIRR